MKSRRLAITVSFTSSVLLAAVAIFGFSAFAFAEDHGERGERMSRISDQYIVVLKDGVSNVDQTETDILSRVRGERIASYRTALSGFAVRMSAESAQVLMSDPRVAFVSEDYVVSIARSSREDTVEIAGRNRTPPSPVFPPPPPPPAPTQILPTGVDRINAETKTNTGSGIHVAVIDTGIDLSHPDLQASIVGGKNCSTGSSYADQNGHGTHVAGTIGARNNSLGVVGVAPGASLWSVRVLDKNGNGSWSSVICGLDFVASKGPANGGPITVANMSLGGGGSSDNNCGNTNSDALHRAICRVRDAGVVVVVAAGNSGANTSGFAPAAYDDAVITVSALVDTNGTQGGGGSNTSYGADDTFASFSNYGTAVDIGAPGVNINSTWLSGGYKSISGTSMASPHVAGAVALYLFANPGSSWTSVRDALIASGEGIGSGHTDPSGKHPEQVLRADSL